MNGEMPHPEAPEERSLADIFGSMEATSYSLYGKLATFSASRTDEHLAQVVETSNLLGERFGEAIDCILELDEPPVTRITIANSLFNEVELEKRVERFSKIIAPAGLEQSGFKIEIPEDIDEFSDEMRSDIANDYKEQFELLLARDLNEVLSHISARHSGSKWRRNLERGGRVAGHIGTLIASAAIGGVIANELNKRNNS